MNNEKKPIPISKLILVSLRRWWLVLATSIVVTSGFTYVSNKLSEGTGMYEATFTLGGIALGRNLKFFDGSPYIYSKCISADRIDEIIEKNEELKDISVQNLTLEHSSNVYTIRCSNNGLDYNKCKLLFEGIANTYNDYNIKYVNDYYVETYKNDYKKLLTLDEKIGAFESQVEKLEDGLDTLIDKYEFSPTGIRIISSNDAKIINDCKKNIENVFSYNSISRIKYEIAKNGYCFDIDLESNRINKRLETIEIEIENCKRAIEEYEGILSLGTAFNNEKIVNELIRSTNKVIDLKEEKNLLETKLNHGLVLLDENNDFYNEIIEMEKQVASSSEMVKSVYENVINNYSLVEFSSELSAESTNLSIKEIIGFFAFGVLLGCAINVAIDRKKIFE